MRHLWARLPRLLSRDVLIVPEFSQVLIQIPSLSLSRRSLAPEVRPVLLKLSLVVAWAEPVVNFILPLEAIQDILVGVDIAVYSGSKLITGEHRVPHVLGVADVDRLPKTVQASRGKEVGIDGE